MPQELISGKLRDELREWFVANGSLRTIKTEFDSAQIPCDQSHEPGISGERRTLIEQYYHSLDFTKQEDAVKVIQVIESVLVDLESAEDESSNKDIKRFNLLLSRDGYEYKNGRIALSKENKEESKSVLNPLPPPDWDSLNISSDTADLLSNRWNEILICVDNKAHLAAIILMGSLLEGLLNADLTEANLDQASLPEVNLKQAKITNSFLCRAHLIGANFEEVDFSGVKMNEANVDYASFRNVKGLTKSKGLLTTNAGSGTRYFQTCQLNFIDRYVDWERLRALGKLPLFGASYSILILIPLFFFGISFYNQKVESLREWAQTQETVSENASIVRWVNDHLKKQPIPQLSLVLLVSTALLAVGSTIYTLFCPSRIKEFSKDQWCDQLRHDLIHYWPYSWKFRNLRIICASTYTLGGLGAIYVLISKVINTGIFIFKNSLI